VQILATPSETVDRPPQNSDPLRSRLVLFFFLDRNLVIFARDRFGANRRDRIDRFFGFSDQGFSDFRPHAPTGFDFGPPHKRTCSQESWNHRRNVWRANRSVAATSIGAAVFTKFVWIAVCFSLYSCRTIQNRREILLYHYPRQIIGHYHVASSVSRYDLSLRVTNYLRGFGEPGECSLLVFENRSNGVGGPDSGARFGFSVNASLTRLRDFTEPDVNCKQTLFACARFVELNLSFFALIRRGLMFAPIEA